MPSWPAIEQMTRAGLTALGAPSDFLALDKVATVVQERYAQVLWVRLRIADADPGAMLTTLLGATARLDAAAAEGIAEVVAQHARLGEWRIAFQLLVDCLAGATVRPAVLVLEGAEYLAAGSPASLDLVASVFPPHSPESPDLLLIGFKEWDSRRLAPHGQVLGQSRLRLDRHSAALLAEAFLPGLPDAALYRSYTLTRGGAGALQIALSAGAALGPEVFCAVTAQSPTGQDLLSALGRRLLSGADQHTLISLAGATRLGVWHPAMASALGSPATYGNEPWWLDLAEGWRQLIPAWRAPLRSAGGTQALDRASLALLADYVATHGARDLAFELYTEAAELGRAADTTVSLARDLASTGCWATLARLGTTLARDSPAIGHRPESDDFSTHAASWWRRRFARLGRQPPGQTGRAHGARQPDLAEARFVPTSRALTSPLALPDTHWVGTLTRPVVMPATTHKAMPDLTAHLLGELRVAFRDRPVAVWASGRGRAVFEFLLVNRHSKVRRDRLMSVFWPEVSPDAARNSLNVAIHGLRQSLRTVAGDTAVVIYQDQTYFIEPTLDIWIDVEDFEEQLKLAHQHLASAEPLKAEAAFEAAMWLYQGEFLADDPYEEWAIVTREHLRLCYLDALDRLGALRLNSGDYAGCVAVCLKLLGYDSCREDAHCRLMRCYSRQGQIQLALRQYHTCVAALRTELNVAPAPATTELFDRLRRREVV
jgi:DNA-binding SARP family transcriptional activator